MTVSDHLKVLGLSLYPVEGSINCICWIYHPSFSLVIEGTYDKKSGKYFYDFYSMKLDPKTKKSKQHRIYCTHVPVKVMYRRVRNYL